MLKDRQSAAIKVAERLRAAEEAIDVALIRASELTGAMVIARTDANLSALVGQDAFEVSAAALTALTRARGDMVETHKRLSEAKIQIGLRTVGVGDLGQKPPAAEFTEDRHLRAVA
jgi:isocitrate lyase